METSNKPEQFSERTFQKIIDKSNIGFSLIDKDFQIVYRSPSAERITGWNTADRRKTKLIDSLHQDDRDAVATALAQVFKVHGSSTVCTFRMMHAKGHLIWLDCTFTNLLEDDDIKAIICNYTDVTARLAAERSLSDTLNELSAYQHALDESAIVAITDQKGLITHVNDNFLRISGYGREELVGQDHKIINSQYHSKEEITNLWRTIANGKIWKGELRNRAKDGSLYWVDTSIVPFLDQKGKPYQYVAIRSDITSRKNRELEVQRTNEEMINLLETISDGFIRLDSNLRYTYVNQQVGKLLQMNTKALLGKYIWDVFPDAIGSPTYKAITEAHLEQRFVGNEDYYAPLGIWQENRVYPNAGGLSIFIRDITLKKQEEQHLKLLESVITNTKDAVLITAAEEIDEPGPKIIYVNQAFEKMSGYSLAETIGRSPRFLQGPKTDRSVLDLVRHAMEIGQPYEATLVNYRKNGNEFWNQFSVSPVVDSSGKTSHFIAIERDVTKFQNEHQQKKLFSDISLAFAQSINTKQSLSKVLEQLVDFGSFWSAEAWLVNGEGKELELVCRHSTAASAIDFYRETSEITSFSKNIGLPGRTWQMGEILHWRNLDSEISFVRMNAAAKYGVKSAYGVPLSIGDKVLGVLVLFLDRDEEKRDILIDFFEKYSTFLSLEINRKQLEQELIQLFNSAPDVICVIDTHRRFKKVNPAMCKLLGYSAAELSDMTIDELVHPDDLAESLARMQNFILQDELTLHFENRYIAKSGRVKYMAWTATKEAAKKELFCVAKDISEKKELERVLDNATKLAKTGGWQVDLRNESVYWSPTTRKILELEDMDEADMESGFSFYQGNDQNIIRQKLNETMTNGTFCDCEFEIKTAKGKLKWIRVIAESEFLHGKCIRLYGSFQDIDDLKRAEISAREALGEKINILESIGDAFFTTDRNWRVTYWNRAASQIMGRAKEEILGSNLWESFPEAVNSTSFISYHEAMNTGKIVHFNDFFAPLQAWYEVNAYPSEKGLSVFFKDVTDRINYIKMIEAHNEKLREISWMQSHMVRAPLSRIMGLMDLIKQNLVTDEEKNEIMEYLIGSANELDEVIRNISRKTVPPNS